MFDLVIYNANIFENDDADTVAINKGRIAYIGREKKLESVCSLDINGKTLLPGFVDSHTHLLNLGLAMNRLDLSQCRTRTATLEKIRDYVKNSTSKVIVGYGWDETVWGERDYLSHKELDFTDRPVMLYRKDMHMAVLNSKAMEICGRTLEGGVFSEESMREVQWLSKPDDPEVNAALRLAGDKAASEGITTVRDIMEFGTMEVIKSWDFPARVFGALYDREYAEQDLTNRNWWGIKIFLDGSIGSRSAAHYGWTKGNLKFTDEGLMDHLLKFWKAGLPVAMHAIGEIAVKQAVKALSNQKGHMRNSIEHFELVEPEILQEISNSTVISSQPNFLQWSKSEGLYENTLGSGWFGKDNPFRIIIDSGKKLAFGSDTMPMGPNYGIGLAVNSGHSMQRIQLHEAVRAYTEGGAYLLHMEDCLGKIRPGFMADLVIQDEKYMEDTKNIGAMKPLATIREGVFTFRSPEFQEVP